MFGGTAKLRALFASLNRSFSPGARLLEPECVITLYRGRWKALCLLLVSFGATGEPPPEAFAVMRLQCSPAVLVCCSFGDLAALASCILVILQR